MTLDKVIEFADEAAKTEVFVELDGKLVGVKSAYTRTDNAGSRVVLVPAKPRVRQRKTNKEDSDASRQEISQDTD